MSHVFRDRRLGGLAALALLLSTIGSTHSSPTL